MFEFTIVGCEFKRPYFSVYSSFIISVRFFLFFHYFDGSWVFIFILGVGRKAGLLCAVLHQCVQPGVQFSLDQLL